MEGKNETICLVSLRKFAVLIPFDFWIGGRSFKSGNFKIILESPNYLATFLRVWDEKTIPAQTTVSLKNGNRSKNGQSSLIFRRNEDSYLLRQITLPDLGYAVRNSISLSSLKINGYLWLKGETVTIALTELK